MTRVPAPALSNSKLTPEMTPVIVLLVDVEAFVIESVPADPPFESPIDVALRLSPDKDIPRRGCVLPIAPAKVIALVPPVGVKTVRLTGVEDTLLTVETMVGNETPPDEVTDRVVFTPRVTGPV